MRVVLKALVLLAPLVLLVFGLRLCTQGAGDRWLMRIRAVDELAVIGLDRPDVIAIGPQEELAAEAGEFALTFKQALAESYGDLLGEGSDRRFVLVMFSGGEMVREYAGRDALIDRKALGGVMGYTDARRNAVFLPPESTFITLRHEIVHLFMNQATEGRVRFSPWLMEGLAEYLQAYYPPKPYRLAPDSRALLRQAIGKGPIDFVRLVRLQDYKQFLVQDGPRNYLEAQVLVAYLVENRREALRAYIEAEKTHISTRYEQFVQIVGDPAGELGEAVRAYIGQ